MTNTTRDTNTHQTTSTIYESAGICNDGNVPDSDRNEVAPPANEERSTTKPSTESKDKSIGLYRQQSSSVPYREDILSCEELKNILKRATVRENTINWRYVNVSDCRGKQSDANFGSAGSSNDAQSEVTAHGGGYNPLVTGDNNAVTIESEQEQ